MIFRANYILAITAIAAPTIGISQIVRPMDDQQKLQSDVGTGPYGQQVQSGFTSPTDSGFGRGHQFNVDLAEVKAEISALGFAGTESEVNHVRSRIGRLSEDVSSLLFDRPSLTKLIGLINAIPYTGTKYPKVTLSEFLKAIKAATKEIDELSASFTKSFDDDAWAYFQNELRKSEHSGSGAIKLGSIFETGTSYAFSTLTYSPREEIVSTSTNFRRTFYLTGSGIAPLNASGTAPTSRVGFGVVTGDPRRVVTGLSFGSYFSPSALDGQASISCKLGAAPADTGTSLTGFNEFSWLERPAWDANRDPHLLDHIRSGDLWLSGLARSLWNSSAVPNGTAFEGSLTYAFRNRSFANDPNQNPNLSTTIELSGTYCAQTALGLDEVEIELRTPVGGRSMFAQPIYASVRYGTRSNCTLAVETRF